MTTFTLTELGNKSGEVVEAAFRGPVDITSRGRRKFVLLTAEDFDRLRNESRQRAFRTDRLSAEDKAKFLAGLDAIADDDAARDE
ncbi:MAG TPA: type II toxin-antitoxin system Phd/YefM family antitoxin [Rhodoblastus sp.]|nr:type II toxin-antitoxin system Phd/YefM family antitoxin [Rhodoblastus sp.]